MKLNKKILTVLVCAVVGFSACQKNDPVLFDNSLSFVAFQAKSGTVNEALNVGGVPTAQTISLPVMLVTLDNNPVTVEFDFSVEGIDNPAIEGEHFELLNTSKTLSFSGSEIKYIEIRTIHNGIYTGNLSVDIELISNSGGYDFGSNQDFRLTIIDFEHPLALVLGTYNITGDDHWGDAINKTTNLFALEGSTTEVGFRFREWIGTADDVVIICDVDLANGIFSIKAGAQDITVGERTVQIRGFTDAFDPIADNEPIRASIDDNGNLTMIDRIGVNIIAGANTGAWFELWTPGVIWTKQVKGNNLNDGTTQPTAKEPRYIGQP